MRPRRSRPVGIRTRFTCERTEGYNVKPGTHVHEWCPFCGHPTDDGQHDIHVVASG